MKNGSGLPESNDIFWAHFLDNLSDFCKNSCTPNYYGMPVFGMLQSRDLFKISLKPELVPKWSFYAKSTKLLFSINTRKIFDLYLFLVVFNPNFVILRHL